MSRKKGPRLHLALTTEELQRLIKAADNPRDKAILYVAYRHGLRASEVGILRYGDWNQDEHRLTITRKKGSLDGIHDMDSAELKLLKAYLRTRQDKLTPNSPLFLSRKGNPIARHTLQDVIHKWAAKASIPKEKAFFHVLKHSIATHLLDGEADIMTIRSWLGHARIENTLEYAKLSDRRRDERVRKAMVRVKLI